MPQALYYKGVAAKQQKKSISMIMHTNKEGGLVHEDIRAHEPSAAKLSGSFDYESLNDALLLRKGSFHYKSNDGNYKQWEETRTCRLISKPEMEKHVSTLQSLTSGNAEVIELAKELKVPSGEDAVYFECLGHNSKEDYMSFFSFDQKNLIKGSYFPGSDPRARTAVNAEVSSSFRAHGRAADAWHVPKKSSSFQADGGCHAVYF